jgi:hypothetical protein
MRNHDRFKIECTEMFNFKDMYFLVTYNHYKNSNFSYNDIRHSKGRLRLLW